MKLVELQEADMYRDGGSFGALFLADDGGEYGLWLERSHMPDAAGLHHRWLFQYRTHSPPEGCTPVSSGGTDEAEILRLLDEFLRSPVLSSQAPKESLRRLRQMRKWIQKREACSSADVIENPYRGQTRG